MALFETESKPKAKTKSKVRPTVVRTQNVAQELQKIAQSYNLKVDELDFNLLEFQTYTRLTDGSKDTEWEEITADELHELDEETALLNPLFQVKQMYEIEIFSKNLSNPPYKSFKLAVGANATKCKVYLSILDGAKVKYKDTFETDLFNMIKKKKIKAGILVGIFDEMLFDAVTKIVAHVRVEENAVYDRNETYLIAKSYEPTPTINDELILHYDKRAVTDEKEKIDYASRDFITSVEEGDILIEYIKAKEGKPGRNCRGEYINPNVPVSENEPKFQIDDTIKIVESDDRIDYIANSNGYITLENSQYTIKTDVDIGEISFKTTGSISAGLDSDVSISVKETDVVKDAIGIGMEVEVTEIDVDGNVGSNAKVFAIRASVSGQTHQSSTVRADKLNINVHKGTAYGKTIHITRLEHGTVDGDTVDIGQATGGDIRAKEINIGICSSHVNATASRMIEIKSMQGSENVFTIDPLIKRSAQKSLDENKNDTNSLEDELKSIKKEMQKYNQLIQDGMSSFVDLKKRLIHYKKSGVKLPGSFVAKYKQFQDLQNQAKELHEEYAVKNDKLKLLTNQVSTFQDNIFDARVINRDRWVGFNEIKFKLVDPELELVFKPAEGSNDKIFGLVEVNEGEFEIQALSE